MITTTEMKLRSREMELRSLGKFCYLRSREMLPRGNVIWRLRIIYGRSINKMFMDPILIRLYQLSSQNFSVRPNKITVICDSIHGRMPLYFKLGMTIFFCFRTGFRSTFGGRLIRLVHKCMRNIQNWEWLFVNNTTI
jgi:hypothetical protein